MSISKTKAQEVRKLRADLAAMLGFDIKKLSIDQVMRLDTVFALKLSLDAMREKIFRGETVDNTKMLAATETLERYLPPKPPPPVVAQTTAEDAKRHMMRLILSAIEAEKNKVRSGKRGAAPVDQVDATELADAQRRIESLEDEVKHLRGTKPRALPKPGAKPMKAATSEWVPSLEPAPDVRASPTPSTSPAPPVAPAAPQPRNPSEGAWNAWRNAGGFGEPVMAAGWIGRLNARDY